MIKKNRPKILLAASDAQVSTHNDFLNEVDKCYEIVRQSEKGDQSELENIDQALILGGDGTLNYFVNHYPFNETNNIVNVLYFPVGTANDFARSLKLIPTLPDFEKFVSIMENSATVEIPLMRCNDQYFINVASVGLPAKVTNSGEDWAKRILGRFNYYLESFEQLISKDGYNIKIQDKISADLTLQSQGFIVSQGMYAGGRVKVTTSFNPHFQKKIRIADRNR